MLVGFHFSFFFRGNYIIRGLKLYFYIIQPGPRLADLIGISMDIFLCHVYKYIYIYICISVGRSEINVINMRLIFWKMVLSENGFLPQNVASPSSNFNANMMLKTEDVDPIFRQIRCFLYPMIRSV